MTGDKMKYILVILLVIPVITFSQTFKVEKVNGKVKILSNGSEQWQDLKQNSEISGNSIISTDKNSSVKIQNDDVLFTLKESSAISTSNIKKMTLDELVLALAMENVINTPRKNNKKNSESTKVYGEKITGNDISLNLSSDFGMKRLNGAKQLAENGMKESAIVTAKEVYRKYPETKKDVSSRMYFADLMYERGLYEEAYDEFNDIKSLNLNQGQIAYVSDKLDQIGKKLIKK
jgi:hypothetical protein